MYNNPDTTRIIARSAIKLWGQNFNRSLLVNSYNDLATSFAVQGEFDSSLVYFKRAKLETQSLKDIELKAMVLNNIGLVYWNQGKFDQAIESYDKVLTQYRLLDKKIVDMANAYNNLGLIHKDKGDFNRAIENFKSHSIQLIKGDSIYIFTDGFADQFGGERGKK